MNIRQSSRKKHCKGVFWRQLVRPLREQPKFSLSKYLDKKKGAHGGEGAWAGQETVRWRKITIMQLKGNSLMWDVVAPRRVRRASAWGEEQGWHQLGQDIKGQAEDTYLLRGEGQVAAGRFMLHVTQVMNE